MWIEAMRRWMYGSDVTAATSAAGKLFMTPEPIADQAAVGDLGAAWGSAIEEVLSIQTLQDDWDGTGAVAPAHETVDTAYLLARSLQRAGLDPPTSVVATPSGAVALTWQCAGNYTEIEVTSPREIDWMIVDADGRSRHGGWRPVDPCGFRVRA